jgi:hypothetical protein
MHAVRIEVHEPQQVDGSTLLAATLHLHDHAPIVVRHEVITHDGRPVRPSARPHLLSALPLAMRLGRALAIDRPIDDTTLERLDAWQQIMIDWHPGQLAHVDLRAAAGAPDEPAVPRRAEAVVAFSGGVDSCFSAAHLSGQPGVPAPAAGAMVQGFDIPLGDDATFASAWARSEAILASLGLEGHRVRTDVRQLEVPFGLDWQTHTHGIWLAAALSCFDGEHAHLTIPSSYPDAQRRIPWGSTSLTDPLLGSATTTIHHDGRAFDKLDKVAAFVDRPAVVEHLRVCWEGERLDRNCGRCFKCLATQACFWACGVAEPGCFPIVADEEDLSTFKVDDPYRRHLARHLVEAARQVGRGRMADLLDERLTT